MKRTFDTETRPVAAIEFRDYRPPRIETPRRNHIPTPPRVESSPIAAIYPQDLDHADAPWRNRHDRRR